MGIHLKRIYDKPEDGDGARVLVDRVWPRGVTKSEANLDYWLKDIAPSTELRKWYGHNEARWNGFRQRYLNELDSKRELLETLLHLVECQERVTLLYATRNRTRNQAVILAEYLRIRGTQAPPRPSNRGQPEVVPD